MAGNGNGGGRKGQADAAKAQPATAPDDPVKPCEACTVTIAPNPLQICGTKTQKDLTATGDPSGGSFTWTVEDDSIAKVSGGGKKVKVKGVKEGKTKVKVSYSAAGCACTDEVEVSVCTCTEGRKYTHGFKHIDRVIGVRAKIKTRYGKVCCESEGCSTKTGYHVVYANISNSTGKLTWAQSGFGRERNEGSKTINTYRYAEMKGRHYKVNYDTAHAPAEGSRHTYQCELDTAKGKWAFSFDGAEWQTYADSGWKGKHGTIAQFVGEIFNSEDDMPGTDGDKCEFTDCQYLQEPEEKIVEEEKPGSILYDFGFDESKVTEEHQAEIDKIAATVAESWKSEEHIVKIRLVGHTDPVGSAGYNKGLGQRRANAVSKALKPALEKQEAGLSGKVAIVSESKGESEVLDASGTDEANARNRRVEVFLSTETPMDYVDAGLVEANVKSDDDAEWGAEWVSGTALNIWDKKPLP